MAEMQIRLVRNLASEIRRMADDGGVNLERVDVLMTLAERVLRAFVLVLAVQPTPVMEECASILQHILSSLRRIASQLESINQGAYGYNLCMVLEVDQKYA